MDVAHQIPLPSTEKKKQEGILPVCSPQSALNPDTSSIHGTSQPPSTSLDVDDVSYHQPEQGVGARVRRGARVRKGAKARQVARVSVRRTKRCQ